MLKMIKGVNIKDAKNLNENFEVKDRNIIANINEEKILKIITDFVNLQDDVLFLIIEVPTNLTEENIINKIHKDVYYMDNLSKKQVEELLKKYGSLFVNDGMAQIGVGNHITNVEIMTNKYNIINIFTGKDDMSKYIHLLLKNNIKKVKKLITAWDFFSKENPGECNRIEENGKNVYDAIKLLEQEGLYFAERREDD